MADYTPELGAEICRRFAAGAPIAAICELEGMPEQSSVWAWRRRYPEFGRLYKEAEQDHADALADQIPKIADGDDNPHKARNRIDARKWRAGTIKPREYGNRLDVNVAQTADPAALHAEGMQRARLMRDQALTLLPQVIDGETVLAPAPTDSKSVSIFD